jgi:hypothetical protein
MDEEMSSFEANSVFELTELPESRKTVEGIWVYSIKRNEQEAVSKFKARWVAKGYSQREGIDFTEPYAPVSKMATLRTLLTIAADEDLELRQIVPVYIDNQGAIESTKNGPTPSGPSTSTSPTSTDANSFRPKPSPSYGARRTI